jgi:hypothetical protein
MQPFSIEQFPLPGPFAGMLTFLSYEFTWRARYKKFFRDFKAHPTFRGEVLVRGQQLAEASGRLAWYQGAGPHLTCFLVGEYLHERFAFANVGQTSLDPLPFTTPQLQVLEDRQKLQQLLPFYKIDWYREHLGQYLLLEDDGAALFFTDRILRGFTAQAPGELPEWNAFMAAMRTKRYDASVLVVVKDPGHLYTPFTGAGPVYSQDLSDSSDADDDLPSPMDGWNLLPPRRPT